MEDSGRFNLVVLFFYNLTCRLLEEKLSELELRLPSQPSYPSIKFRSYKDRKRILITGGAGFVGSHLVDKVALLYFLPVQRSNETIGMPDAWYELHAIRVCSMHIYRSVYKQTNLETRQITTNIESSFNGCKSGFDSLKALKISTLQLSSHLTLFPIRFFLRFHWI